MKRIARNIALVLILIFALSGLNPFSFTCYAQTKTENNKEYYMELAEIDVWAVMKSVDFYKDQPWAREVIEKAAEKEPWTVMEFVNHYKNQPWAREVIENIAKKEPWAALADASCYVDQPWAQKVIEEAVENMAENDPRKIPPWLASPEVKKLLQKSKKPVVRGILIIYGHLPFYSFCLSIIEEKVCAILEEIVSKDMTFEEAADIVRDDRKFFETLMRIKSKPNHLGKVVVDDELKNVALRIVQKIRNLYNEPNPTRFESIKGLNSQELYTFISYGEEEIFTSLFNGLFDRLLDTMETEKMDGDQLLERLGYNKFRVFVKLCAGFNRLNEFLETMEKDLQKFLLRKFATGIDKEKNNLAQAVVIADIFSMVEDKEILRVLQETIKIEHERAKLEESKEGKILYGLLAGMFGEKVVINVAWIKEMAEKYQLPDLTRVPSGELFNSDGINVQQYFFYDDEDGRLSFWNFINQYEKKTGWEIEDKGSFILIESVGGNKKIEIYANKPEAAENGPEEIAGILKERNIQPVVVAHRGHSYHVPKTIERMSTEAKIVSLGSCGGYNNIGVVLERVLKAHIISTKAKGTMFVNDPLLKMLNDEMLNGKDICWPEFWQKVEKRLGRIGDFRNYISPHKNLGVMFLKAYYRLLGKN